MAKKTSRILLLLVCTQCKSQNYITAKNKINSTDKITLKKYCKKCKAHTEHKESTKLK
ncbi:50S ribosomal protein L33 [candidate division WWE3 bacterium RIFCSPHIGHO2_01_FULL_40_23]|uniref:Large ribosomal subunit protein bL33 n=1 Tax=candidate division WWE3 bacterium RIFCSPLOWO2_01_FULL_41_18 TaxID=1802625 RepID=A0A1F4VEB6_UNCKA|nr:MAG: 50S ribosomal protein L33 [candidate division WWE3 bacterium RIFCSPHIGHO2_01_FULL_40_23]OGC55527.1 MAG: 50S ribosomal protein L33 [candidate division WWE3 bacterium RIFCSPLOWO2_01_FULL_41_18]